MSGRYAVGFSQLAQSDLGEIVDWIAADSPESADRFIKLLRRKICERLEFSPYLSRETGLLDGVTLRRFLVRQYWVFFRIVDGKNLCEVLRVVHTSRELMDLHIE